MITSQYANNVFNYSNRSYTCSVTLYTKDENPDANMRMVCDAREIEEIVYESKLNDLLINGHIIYTDKYGTLDKLLSQQYCYCELFFCLNKNKVDNSINIKAIDENNKFVHQFIVNNIKILTRKLSVITYQIDILSVNWFKCIANLQYSNYGNHPEPILDIIKKCFVTSQLSIHEESFNNVKTLVKMNYITQLNDNLFTTLQYLLHKLYYNYDIKDDSLKFFVYDQFADKYRLIDLKQKNTALATYSTIISFFKTNNEVIIQQEPTNMGSFKNALKKISLYSNIFNINLFQYFHDTNTITNFPVSSQSLTNYLNNKIDNGNYEQKYQPMINYPTLRHEHYGSYWNTNNDIYDNSIQCLTENNSLILNITGEIRRQPGTYTIITIDRSLTNLTSEDKKELEKIKSKYKAYEGIWMASKVRNIISPSKQTFRQQVVLFRNFIPKMKATS